MIFQRVIILFIDLTINVSINLILLKEIEEYIKRKEPLYIKDFITLLKLFDTKIPYKLRKELIDMLREEFKDDRKSNARTY
jgi:hypothetical protein